MKKLLALLVLLAFPVQAATTGAIVNPTLQYSDGTNSQVFVVSNPATTGYDYQLNHGCSYCSFTSQFAATGPNPITVGGTPRSGDVVGINITYNSTAYTPRYTVMSGDTTSTIAAGIASSIVTAMSIPSSAVNSTAYFNLFYPGAGSVSGYSSFLSGGATETLTINTSIPTWLEVAPALTLGRMVPGRNGQNGDLIGMFSVVSNDSSTPNLVHNAFQAVTLLSNASPGSLDVTEQLETPNENIQWNGSGMIIQSPSCTPTGGFLGDGKINVCGGYYVNGVAVGGSGSTYTAGTGLSLASNVFAMANNTPNTIAGYNGSGVFTQYGIGSGLAISGSNITATGGGSGGSGALLNMQVFTSGGTYTPTTGTSHVAVYCQGGGGGGGGTGTGSPGSGSTGSTTSLGALCSSLGGIGGMYGTNSGTCCKGGWRTSTTSAGTIVLQGSAGLSGGAQSAVEGGNGGAGIFGTGSSPGGLNNGTTACSAAGINSGAGGSGAGSGTSGVNNAGGGEAGDLTFYYGAISGTPTVTIGAGGAGGSAGTSGNSGCSGGSGIVIIYEYQ